MSTVQHRSPFSAQSKLILFFSAAALRLILAIAFPALPDLLTARVEISTPVNSFVRLQEGVFLYERGLDPYQGGIFHQAPLLLPLFTLIPSPTTPLGFFLSIALYTALDLLTADYLYNIALSGAAQTSWLYISSRKDRAWTPISVAAVYLFNPYTLATCLARPTTVFTTFLTLLSISHAVQSKAVTAAFALAVASYASLHPVLLLPPVGLLCYDQSCRQKQQPPIVATTEATVSKTETGPAEVPISSKDAHLRQTQRVPKVVKFLLRQFLPPYVATLLLLHLLSFFLLGNASYLGPLYLTPLTLPDLTPNPGLWWYFFTEMFDAFRSFFLGVFWLHMSSYSIPLTLRLRKQPLAAVVLMMGVVAVFEPYACVGDAGAWLSCLGLLSHTFELSITHRFTFPALSTLLYATLLGPAFLHLWLYAGSGNANFFYAITLVWSLALLVLLTDAVYAVVRDEWETEKPEAKGKAGVRQI